MPEDQQRYDAGDDDFLGDLGAEIRERMHKLELEVNAGRVAEALPLYVALKTGDIDKVLAWLRSKTIERQPTPEELACTDAAELGIRAARRQGRDQFYFFVLDAIETARRIKE